MSNLKPCPFCGADPMIHDIEPHLHRLALAGEHAMPPHPGSTVIECGCGAGLIDESREVVIERWNRRAAASALPVPAEPPLDVAAWEYSVAHADGTRRWIPCGDAAVTRLKSSGKYVVRSRTPTSEVEKNAAPEPSDATLDAMVEKSWGRFENELHRSHDKIVEMAGEVARRFEAHMGHGTWTDPAYRQDASTWTAAWNAALAAQKEDGE